ncbi:hypothetical protein PQR05_37745 [Paraburkholderia sediminicola]|uniref:hypothetical protein n=1 Tax=Paraburkholderia sediminicola TaxID=458836 RepID=UPI0038BCCA30
MGTLLLDGQEHKLCQKDGKSVLFGTAFYNFISLFGCVGGRSGKASECARCALQETCPDQGRVDECMRAVFAQAQSGASLQSAANCRQVAELLWSKGRYADAERAFKFAADAYDQVELPAYAALNYRLVAECCACCENFVGVASAYLQAAKCHEKAGDWAQAAEAGVGAANAYRQTANWQLALDESRNAAQAFERAAKMNYDFGSKAQAFVGAAHAYHLAGSREQERCAWEHAVTNYTNSASDHWRNGNIELAKDAVSEASEARERVVQLLS